MPTAFTASVFLIADWLVDDVDRLPYLKAPRKLSNCFGRVLLRKVGYTFVCTFLPNLTLSVPVS